MKRLLPLALLVCLVVGCGSSGACPHGSELVLRAIPLRGGAVTPAGMKLVQQVLESRVATIGVAEPSITLRGSDEIVVDGVGKDVPKRLTGVVVTGKLEFFDFEHDLVAPTVANGHPTPYASLYSLLTAVEGAATTGTPAAYYLFDGSAAHRVLAGPAGTPKALLASLGGKRPKGSMIVAVPANREAVFGPVDTQSTKPVGSSPSGTYWYLFKLPPEISGSDLNESQIGADQSADGAGPEVLLGFKSHGAREFEAITRAEYKRGKALAGFHGSAGIFNPLYAQHNAIVLDGKLIAAPYIDYTDTILSLGISGGKVTIGQMGSMPAARNLALVLQSGSLPYRLVRVSLTPGCGR